MERQFGLIKNEFGANEKRILPRFPFCYLTFKESGGERVYEVKDISTTGMQLALKDGEHVFREASTIEGTLRWFRMELRARGTVKWATSSRMGVAFETSDRFDKEIVDLLSPQNIARTLRPIHDTDFVSEFPANLRYWLRSDGPMEVFVWQHPHGEISKIQILLMERFVEWEDGQGLRTGRILSKRDLDTPLFSEDEFLFRMDESSDPLTLRFASEVVSFLNSRYMRPEVLDFIRVKLGKHHE